MVTSSRGNWLMMVGPFSFWLEASARPGSQSVRCSRAGYLPVRMLARVGEHTEHAAWASVKRMPRAASRSRCGVSWKVLP